MLFYRFLAAAVGLRTGAGTFWRKHANSRLSILVCYLITYHRGVHGLTNLNPVSLGLSTGNGSANLDSDDELDWSEWSDHECSS